MDRMLPAFSSCNTLCIPPLEYCLQYCLTSCDSPCLAGCIHFLALWQLVSQSYALHGHALLLCYANFLSASNWCLQTAWLTPTEIFTPYWGEAIAKYMHEQTSMVDRKLSQLDIVEVGGGTGTLARDILTWFRREDHKLYKKVSYTSLELSPGLAKAQLHRMAQIEGHRQRFKVCSVKSLAQHIFTLASTIVHN